MSRIQTSISSGWEWRLANANQNSHALEHPEFQKWTPAVQFPSVIHIELLHTKQIPNPNIGENERQFQWVGECDWEYRCSFPTPSTANSPTYADLVFEGLDTYAIVKLNGFTILESNNMFLPARIDVKKHLKAEGENELVILFESPLRKGTQLEDEFGPRTSMMRDKRCMHMRKAQYHWGWDWGPIIVTSGPYLPITLETYSTRIDDLFVTTTLSSNNKSAELSVDVKISQSVLPGTNVHVEVRDPSGHTIKSEVFELEDVNGNLKLGIENSQLWWPNLHGDQHLYTIVATLSNKKEKLDTKSVRVGIRTIRVIQRPLDNEPGTTFMFNVNGVDIFTQGGDWIPADNLLPRIDRAKYFAWIEMAKRANLNMIRVWGGGIYETDDFFDACDELGLLVWHDYALACGDYPIHDAFLESLKQEVKAQTLRLRGRTSLALLCGNNEDFMLADYEGEPFPGTYLKKKNYDHLDVDGPFEDTEFPQRKIYLDAIPKIAKELCPDVQYWPSSPWGGAKIANDLTVGDVHQWDVWHGKSLSYQSYKHLAGRFVSEFGMHGYPDMRTVKEFAPNREDQHPQSKAIDCHNKGHGAETRIARYLAENFRYSQDLEKFAYVSQLMQSEAYGYACRDWKRKFGGKGKESCAGLIIWQLNDVYPCTSWAFVDYHLRPKPAFYNIRRAFAPVSVGIDRTPWSRWIDDDHPRETEIPQFEVFATSIRQQKMTLVLKAYDMQSWKYVEVSSSLPSEVELSANQNTELGKVKPNMTEESLIVLSSTLLNEKGEAEARLVNWPEPFRYLQWHTDTKVSIKVHQNSVDITTNYPVKGCLLYVDYEDGEDATWEDNMLDLMPGETLSVKVWGLEGREVKTRFLNDWEL